MRPDTDTAQAPTRPSGAMVAAWCVAILIVAFRTALAAAWVYFAVVASEQALRGFTAASGAARIYPMLGTVTAGWAAFYARRPVVQRLKGAAFRYDDRVSKWFAVTGEIPVLAWVLSLLVMVCVFCWPLAVPVILRVRQRRAEQARATAAVEEDRLRLAIRESRSDG